MSSSTIVAARPWEGASVGACFDNVQEMIRRQGGDFCYGWTPADFGPHPLSGQGPSPLYRRWLNHVVWRDPTGDLWEVTPHALSVNCEELRFDATEFAIDTSAMFEFAPDGTWLRRPCRYVPLRQEGKLVVELLTQAQQVTGDDQTRCLELALVALQSAGFQPREWRLGSTGERTRNIWLIVD